MTDFSTAIWHKSTKTQQSGQCVEVTRIEDAIGIRDSKDPQGPILIFTFGEFTAFLGGIARGEFDDLI